MFNYDNIGGKIKNLAQTIAIIQIIGCVVAGIGLMSEGDEGTLIGLLVIGIGSLLAWVSSWVMYALGDAVESLSVICDNVSTMCGSLLSIEKNEEAAKPAAPKKPASSAAKPKTTEQPSAFAKMDAMELENIFCTHCGTSNPKGSKTCWKCNKSID